MLIAIKRLVPELPIPYPLLIMSSRSMTTMEAKVSWITISMAFPVPTSSRFPYIPDHVYAKACPKAIKMPISFWAPSKSSFYSLTFWSTLISLAPANSCMIIEDVTKGEIPNSISEPRLEANMTLIQ